MNPILALILGAVAFFAIAGISAVIQGGRAEKEWRESEHKREQEHYTKQRRKDGYTVSEK